MFLTTPEFLPQHRSHRRQTLQLITAAEAHGQTRLVEMNRQVLGNLDRIITALTDDPDKAASRCRMRADNSQHVIAAARQRSQATRRSAVAALRRLDNAGTPITFDGVAREANVSRSWLYNQPDLRAEIERLRDRARPVTHRLVPDRQRATDASLRRRVELAAQRIRQLETDNQRLRQALAEALGQRRVVGPNPARHDTPVPQDSTTTGPC